MKIPRIKGTIRRRLLINYRIDPAVMSERLPEPFRPKLHRGQAIGGICLIRLERIRPTILPFAIGLSSENAAHRIAVVWGDGPDLEEGVFVPRRDSNSWFNHLVGGNFFPGEQHPARFDIGDEGAHVEVRMSSQDGTVGLHVSGDAAQRLPSSSIFSSVEEASCFFERGSLGYSATREIGRYDGLVLDTETWKVSPLHVRKVYSSYFEDETLFPAGSVHFDHALIMRNIEHQWIGAPDLYNRARQPTTA